MTSTRQIEHKGPTYQKELLCGKQHMCVVWWWAYLFFSCDFSQNSWIALGIEWNAHFYYFWYVDGGQKQNDYQMFQGVLDHSLTGCWSQWKHGNGIIFDHKQRNLEYCISCFKEHFTMVIKRSKPILKEGMQSWLDYLQNIFVRV